MLEDVLRKNACFSLKNLAINGRDIIDNTGISTGKDIGRILNESLSLVLDGILPNEKDVLLNYIITKESEIELER